MYKHQRMICVRIGFGRDATVCSVEYDGMCLVKELIQYVNRRFYSSDDHHLLIMNVLLMCLIRNRDYINQLDDRQKWNRLCLANQYLTEVGSCIYWPYPLRTSVFLPDNKPPAIIYCHCNTGNATSSAFQ